MSPPKAIKLTPHVRTWPLFGISLPNFLGSNHGEISTKKQKSHTLISMLANRCSTIKEDLSEKRNHLVLN